MTEIFQMYVDLLNVSVLMVNSLLLSLQNAGKRFYFTATFEIWMLLCIIWLDWISLAIGSLLVPVGSGADLAKWRPRANLGLTCVEH